MESTELFFTLPTHQPTTTIEELPEEVLELVFGFLSLIDRKRSRLVCKRWLQICNRPRVTKNDVIVVKGIFSPFERRNREFWDFPRNFTFKHLNFRLKHINFDQGLGDFLSDNGSLVRSIEVAPQGHLDCNLEELYSKIGLCPNIESLFLGNLFTDKDDEILDQYFGSFERLTSLELTPVRTTELLIFIDNRTSLKHFGLSSFTNKDILEICLSLIEGQAHSLEQFYIELSQDVSNKSFHKIIDLLGSQLKVLHIPCEAYSSGPLSPAVLLKISNKFPNLEELDLSQHRYLDSMIDRKNLNSGLIFFENLKCISLAGTTIWDDVLYTIASLKRLQGLDLSQCENLTADGFANAFGLSKHKKLLKLRLCDNDWVTDDFLCRVLPYFPSLTSLYLGDNSSEVTSKGLSAIFTNCKMLTCLSLKWCPKIESLIEPTNINVLKSLTFLDLEDCFSLSVESLFALNL